MGFNTYHMISMEVREKSGGKQFVFFARLEFSKMRIKTQETVNLLLSCSKYGKFKARFRRRSFHEPNLIP